MSTKACHAAFFGAALFAATLLHAAALHASSPTSLLCEYANAPLGVDVAQPRLSWRLDGNSAALTQKAYQLLVASSAELLAADKGDLWDSGRVDSDVTTHVRYAGKKLVSAQQVFWKLRFWDAADQASAWSKPSTWTMGMVANDEWKGTWIVAPWTSETLYLRRNFELRAGLRRALVNVCGLGHYEMSLNGERVGKDLFTPGWTDYDKSAIYDTYDVTPQLRTCTNPGRLTLPNGLYNVLRRNRFAKFTKSFGPLRAILQLRLEYEDGSVDFVGTDDSWRVRSGAITYSSIYGGEDYEPRLLPAGWDKPGFDDSSWVQAVTLVRPKGELMGMTRSSEPVRAIETHKAVSVRQLAPNRILFDFGQNASHVPLLRVSGPAGSSVKLRPGEVVDAKGEIERGTMGGTGRGPAWWLYTKAGAAEETWFPQFYYVGCRYLLAELTPAPGSTELPSIVSLDNIVIHADLEATGSFACSNPLLNRTREIVRWAQRSNMVSVLTDCPHREKLGWIEQYHLNGPAIRYEFDVARIFTKGMADMAEEQTEEGLIPNIAPEYADFKGAFRGAAEWGAAFIEVPWQQYQFNGDKDLLEKYYPAMKRYLSYLEERTKEGILSDGLGDWFDVGPGKGGKSQHTPPPVTATAFLYHDAELLSRIAALLGKADEARDLATRANSIRDTYNRKFYNTEAGSYATGSQCANALALCFGLVEPANRDKVFAALVKDFEGRGCTMTAGDIGFRYLLLALSNGGRSDLIYTMLNQDEKPGYGYMIKKGATATTEAWNANLGTSHNHFMLGQVTEWFYGHLVGISSDPEGPGFKKILIRPTPVGDLTWAEASYRSMHGTISVRWERKGSALVTKVTIPPNTTATIAVPSKTSDVAVTVGAATQLRRDGDRVLFSAVPGSYSFESVY